jgi:hypothetical protein
MEKDMLTYRPNEESKDLSPEVLPVQALWNGLHKGILSLVDCFAIILLV